MADSPTSTKKEDNEGPQASTEPTNTPSTTRTPQRTFLGQTKASWYIYWICAVASIANIFQGFDSGIYSIIISDSRFINYFNVSGARSGVVASMVNLGNVIGNLFVAWWFIAYLGRCHAFALGTIILLVGVALQAGAVAFAMIVLTGESIGTNLAAYQAEVSSPLIRGRVVSFVQLSYQIGVLIAYCVGLGTVKIHGEDSWRVATALQVIPGVILIIASFSIPESPRWILERYPEQKARVLKQLSKIRCLPETDEEVQQEYLELVAAHQYRLENEGAFTWRRFLSSYSMWKRIGYGMATMALGQISGVGALMLYGSALMVISYIIIGALADAYPAPAHFNKGAAIVQVMFIYIIEMAYSGALGPCAWIYASEIFPSDVRDKGVNISQSGQQMTTLWINQAWPVMFDNVGHNAYYILVGINLLGLISVVLFWPETKGISLEHMDRLFDGVDRVEAYKEAHRMTMQEDEKRVLEEVKGRDFS
ncbi:general substrate transporter [Stipitochalara longipes BDJ]|nr:general substrate transporter [Stipitochalara longipes BDJ]